MTPAELEALKALLAKANVKGLPFLEAATAGRELVFALLNAAHALIAAAEREGRYKAGLERVARCDPIRAHNIARQALAENAG